MTANDIFHIVLEVLFVPIMVCLCIPLMLIYFPTKWIERFIYNADLTIGIEER